MNFSQANTEWRLFGKKEDQEAACGGGKQKMTPQKQGTELALTPASLLKHDFS